VISLRGQEEDTFPRRGLAIPSTLMEECRNWKDDALENSVTSNIENLVLLYLELLIVEMEVGCGPMPQKEHIFLYINVTHPHRTRRGCYHRARPSERDGR